MDDPDQSTYARENISMYARPNEYLAWLITDLVEQLYDPEEKERTVNAHCKLNVEHHPPSWHQELVQW